MVFNIDHVLAGRIPIGDNECRFDYNVFEETIKKIIRERADDENCTMDFRSSSAHTFVVTRKALDAAAPTVIRSYSGQGVRANKCPLWQAARATTAAPSFFKAMYIDNPRPGIHYIDGGLGHNNPSQIALTEAQRIWPDGKRFCLVSVGTGRQKATRLIQTGRVDLDVYIQLSILRNVISAIPRVAATVPGWEIAKNFPPGVLALIKIAGALAELVTNSEDIHQQLEQVSKSADLDKQFPYFRFNVEPDLGNIGLEDWSKEEDIAAYTATYLEEYGTRERRMACVKSLTSSTEPSGT